MPPPIPGVPLPPPPPCGGVAKQQQRPVKKVPKPGNPLKSFNWSKLPESKLHGTIWSGIDESKIYEIIDLKKLDSTFSAYQRQQESFVAPKKKYDSQEDVMTSAGSVKKQKELAVIDGRRAQNCTILLSKLKITNDEMKKSLLSCDQNEYLQKDMLEQLIKFIPTKEEVDLLNEHKNDIQRMAKADRFLFEMSRIFRYEQRLHALFYKKKFHERISELQPKVEVLLKASKEILRSKKLKKILEIVLALGNYMNKGTRGNAYGFRLQSLNKIADTKSSTNRSTSLMNFLLTILESCENGSLLKLPLELANVEKAARCNVVELEKDANQLRVGLSNLKKEIEILQTQDGGSEEDRFVRVMSDFVTVASLSFAEVDEILEEAKTKYSEVVRCFGEDQTKIQAHQFFQLFTDFLDSFESARKENEKAAKLKKVEEENRKKRLKEEQIREMERKRPKKRTVNNSASGGENGGRGEFDDLIGALKSGKVFEKKAKNHKRSRASRGSTTTSSGGYSLHRERDPQ